MKNLVLLTVMATLLSSVAKTDVVVIPDTPNVGDTTTITTVTTGNPITTDNLVSQDWIDGSWEGTMFPDSSDINENHQDYEAMLIGNYIMGGGPLSSRIADRVRKQDGLSYTAMTRFQADDQDERGMYMMFCISNPMNTEKVVETVREEVDRMLESGVTGDELQKAKESFLINRRGGRARDGQLASELLSNMKTGRTMEFQNASDDRISTLTKEQVDAAMKKVIDPDRLLIITAGDFNKAKSESNDN